MSNGYAQAIYKRRNTNKTRSKETQLKIMIFFFSNLQILKRIFEKSMGKWITHTLVMGVQIYVTFLRNLAMYIKSLKFVVSLS